MATTFWALVITVDAFFNACLAERMTAFSDVGVFVSLTTDHAFCIFRYDFVHTYFKGLIVVAFGFC